MLKSCQYCGRFHPVGVICPKKPKPKAADTRAARFRSTAAWQRKRAEIKARDLHLCQLCIRGLYLDGKPALAFRDTQVHHIAPLAEDWSRRLEDENLLTLCPHHHEMAEDGRVPREELIALARAQNHPPGEGGAAGRENGNTTKAPQNSGISQNESGDDFGEAGKSR